MRRELGRLPLVVVFGVVSLLAMTVVAGVLHTALRGMIEERAVSEAIRAGEFAAHVGLRPVLPDELIGAKLDEDARRRVDEAVASGLGNGVLTRVKVFDREGLILYSDNPDVIGTRRPTDDPFWRRLVDDDLAGHKFADTDRGDHAGERHLGQLMEVFVPLHDEPGQVVGVAELYVPFDRVQAGIVADTTRLVVLLVGGLAFLWLVLFRLVQVVSRQLRRELERNEYQALHDALTGLPNRTLLFDRVDRAISEADRHGTQVGVLLLDLDRFKEVNDTLGHHNGDRLLVEVASRLRGVLRSADTLVRLGGDEFAVLVPDVDGDADVGALARRLVEVLKRPVDIDGLSVAVGVSVGIALHPEDGTTPQVLLQRADVAMYVAKTSHLHFARYSEDADHYSPERLALLGELRHALERDELALYFQPKADTRTGRVHGLEALLRWHHPERGLIPPDVFIPLAEHTGLIDEVTPFVVEQALTECARWGAAGHDVSVSVNVSVRNLVDRGFPDRVAELLTASGVPASRLVLELTESALMTDPDTALDVLNALKAVGVVLSIDDYGSGYSSLAYLQQLPVDELKIDRQFVRQLGERDKDRAIVRSTVDLGRNLGLLVVAEGVEDQAAWDTLAEAACDVVQGYFLSRPIPAGDVLAWLDRYDPAERAGDRLALRAA